ncbi:glycosyltransferase family 4 protein [Brevibacterium linens ATCC 9172]|nr:glycosyltransferase family 4 protein [Brevibacterium linens ATCC 9172]
MDVLMIAHFTRAGRRSRDRFDTLAGILARRGANVELVTSTFHHLSKQQKDIADAEDELYRTTYISEPSYRTNVSVRRLLSHQILGRNLTEYLRHRRAPDVVYCAVPSLEVARAAAEFAAKNDVRLVVDVQDLWPEAFELVLRPHWAGRRMLRPLRRTAERIYRAADAVVTVSETYSNRVSAARGDDDEVTTVYLGTDLRTFDGFGPTRPVDDGYIELAYIGTLGHSYDLPTVFDALRLLKRQGLRMRLHVMGTGPFENQWRRDAADLSAEVIFYGSLEYSEMVARLRGCDIAVNPIVPGAAQSITNKIGDYAAAGLPVVNSQECQEYRDLLAAYGAGISCEQTADSIAAALVRLSNDRNLAERGGGSRRMAEERFDRGVTYERLSGVVLGED